MKTILCFGDSNTYGYIPETAGRYPEDIRWTGVLNSKVRDLGYRVIEEGLVGRTSIFPDQLRPGRRGSDFLPVLLESHYPVDSIVLMLGTNDCKTVYLAEEVKSTYDYKRLIRANDRATLLNLMVGLNAYTFCSGIICEELNGDGYRAIALEESEKMRIGYIKRKAAKLSSSGKIYVEELKKYENHVIGAAK